MALEQTEVVELIKKGVSQEISDAREYSGLLNMHVTGKGIKEYTEEFNSHESDVQRELRERLMKSNKALFSWALRPIDKVFTAKGGAINYNVSTDKVDVIKEATSDVADGLDLKTFLNKIVKTNYIIDPNGFFMVDIDKEGNLETKVHTVHDVIYYSKRGNQITSIIFNPIQYEDDDKKYYRVLDENTDSFYIQDGDNVYLDESTVLTNFFGYVPAYILGDKVCPNTGMFLSLIDDVLDDANEHLRDVSVNVVHKLSHGYAKYWQYPENCTTCGGDGVLHREVNGEVKEVVCHTCEGSGVKNHKDASDLLLLDIPKQGEQVLAPEVGGYINPSMEVWKQYKEDIADLKQSIFQSLWGSTFKVDTSNETATGRLLNVQPEAERVASISKTFARIHKFGLDALGRVALGLKDYSSNVSYGTRYLMESPDEILNTLKEAKTSNLPITIQKNLTDRYYQTEYQNNPQEYQKISKLLSVDPFPAMTPIEVKALGITGIEFLKKVFFEQWLNQLDEAKQLLMTQEQLKEDLTAYVKSINTEIQNDEEVQ